MGGFVKKIVSIIMILLVTASLGWQGCTSDVAVVFTGDQAESTTISSSPLGTRGTIIVDVAGGRDYMSIQDAIDAALPGDTIRVFSGRYQEILTIDKPLTIIGNGSGDTIIDGDYRGSVITSNSSGISLSKISIINGGNRHSGIDIGHYDSMQIEDCHISSHRVGIIGVSCDFITVINCTIDNTTRAGVQLNGNNNLITGNSISNSSVGTSVRGYNNTLSLNHYYRNERGISVGTMDQAVLMMGNSYIQANNMDVLTKRLLGNTIPTPVVKKLTAGGLTLSDHADRVRSINTTWNITLKDGRPWDAVILQDQSQIPGYPTDVGLWQESLAGAMELDGAIEHAGADTVLLMTWGRRDGLWGNANFNNFSLMQGHLEEGYRWYAENLSKPHRPVYIAPVGLAYKHIHDSIVAEGEDPTQPGTLFHDLYNSDGSHPSLEGSYLAACVLYATLTGNSPVGLSDSTSLSAAVKLGLQQAATSTVFNETQDYSYPWQEPSGSLIHGNRIEDNMIGMTIGCSSSDNIVVNNSFVNNSGLALKVLDSNSHGNSIHHNGFKDNNNAKVQAFDGGNNTLWDDGDEGNYWEDLPARYPGATHDGWIWNTPYDVLGNMGGMDRYPLVRFLPFEDHEAPVALGGTTIAVDEGTLVALDGRASKDNVGIVSYRWTFYYDGGHVELVGPVHQFLFGVPGDYFITLNVTDAADNWGIQQFTISVIDTTDPIAVISTDSIVEQHQNVKFDGTGSRDNVGVVNWTWNFLYDDQLIILYDPMVTFTFDLYGNYMIELTVRDGQSNKDTEIINILVMDVDPPHADAGADIIKELGERKEFDGTASTDNVGIVSWVWTFNYSGEQVILEGEKAWTVFQVPGIYTVVLTVTDDGGRWSTDDLTVTVVDVNDPVADAGKDIRIDQHQVATFTGEDSYDDHVIATWGWTFVYDGAEVTLEGTTPTFLFEIAGMYNVILTVTDHSSNSATDEMRVIVADITPPVAAAGEDRAVDQGTKVALDGSGSTDNLGVVRWTWTFVYEGEGVVLDGKKTSFTFDVPGDYPINMTVEDAAGNKDDSQFVIFVKDTVAPTLPEMKDVEAGPGEAVTMDASDATDNVGVIKWSWTFEEEGRTVVLEGPSVEHTFEETGEYKVTLTLSDEEGNQAKETFEVNVVSSSWLWIALVLVAAALVASGYFIVRRRKPE